MTVTAQSIEVRECSSLDELDACVSLQREVFALPDLEISPRRHLIVTRSAGGFVLGAFSDGQLIGFVLSVPGFCKGEKFFYSHMTAVKKEFQSHGIGAKLKWAQRDRALRENVNFIKWTFEPVQARNAFFNLMRLGAVVKEYAPNYYGTDYNTTPGIKPIGLDSDRLIAEWDLNSVRTLNAAQKIANEPGEPVKKIVIPPDWKKLVIEAPERAKSELLRIRSEFQQTFSEGLVCEAFERDENSPAYLIFKEKNGNLSIASP